MQIFLSTLHLMACLVLIGVVLLQRGKGADMGAMLGGGGANTVFGSRGAGSFLTRVTTACAVIFMVTSLSLSYLSSDDGADVLFDEELLEPETAPEESGLLEEIPTDAGAGDGGDANLLQEIPQPEAAPEASPAEAP